MGLTKQIPSHTGYRRVEGTTSVGYPIKYRTSTEQVPNKHYGALQTDNPNIERLIIAVADQQISVTQMMERISLKHRPTFLENYLNPAMNNGFIRQLYPQSPRHPRQKYLLTVKGMALYNKISQNK